MTIRICVSILPKTVAEAKQLIAEAEQLNVDFVEVRLDNLEKNVKLADLTVRHKVPLIATDKSRKSETERQAFLLTAAKSGFRYVDAELSSLKLQSFIAEAKSYGAKCVVSFHDPNKTPSIPELTRILEREVSSGADVCKIVTTAKKMEDNLTLLQFLQSAPVRKKPVCFAMGALGKTSRLLSPTFGGFFTFASLNRGCETAPGQMTVGELRSAYELLGLK
ncbi:MAG: type I 3-dehydroquinate dehydratase [Candidatus Bathyarchaeota archaeon]|nr:type I 3-dehydroquinate dehydratase [Candidatus Bathyarchaeota archaeon]